MPFRILCADSSVVIQRGIDALCQQTADCRIDRFACSRDELHQALAEEHFDVLVTNCRIDGTDFLEEAFELKSQLRDLRLILYTENRNSTTVARAVAYRFYDAVFRDGPSSVFIDSLRSLERGEPPPQSILLQYRDYMTRSDWPPLPKAPRLTKREIHIVAMLGLGLSNREISLALGIGIETTKEHVRNLLRKLKLPDRTAVAVWGLKQPALAALFPATEAKHHQPDLTNPSTSP
ncbi:MAG: response regulator transcription factor [Pirellula sp.]|jgi:DNA-binding NarL/FixJ family response regulator|nr:response regulator transcription factor [Pirellula sp.]